MKREDTFKNCRLSGDDVLYGLTWDRVGQETDEIRGMARLEGHTNLAVGFESADAGSMAGARVDDHEGPLLVIDLDALRRDNAGQNVVHRARQLAPVHDELGAEFEYMRRGLSRMLLVLLTPLLHDIDEQDTPLPRIDPVGPRSKRGVPKESGGKGCCFQFGWYLTSHTVLLETQPTGVKYLRPF